MAPKKKQAAKANEAPIINGSQALQLKAALDAGQTLDDEVLLKLLQADSPCEGLYSKACKVRTNLLKLFKVIRTKTRNDIKRGYTFLLLYYYSLYFSQVICHDNV
jgi:hypothetical protein